MPRVHSNLSTSLLNHCMKNSFRHFDGEEVGMSKTWLVKGGHWMLFC